MFKYESVNYCLIYVFTACLTLLQKKSWQPTQQPK